MAKSRIISVEVKPIDLGELIDAAEERDKERVGELLDEALQFKGLAGSLLERVDDEVFERLADMVCDIVDQARLQR